MCDARFIDDTRMDGVLMGYEGMNPIVLYCRIFGT